jgi:DNA-binding transcriptional ArsR family regulator
MKEERMGGTTLKVYMLLLAKKDGMGVREIQKGLNISSPSVVHYHLMKLMELGLVKQDNYGRYVAVKGFDASYLGPFVILGGKVVPRYAFYGAFFTSFIISYIFVFGFDPKILLPMGLASIILWLETYWALKGLMR